MKVTVGGRERFASVSLAIPPGEDAWIEFEAGTFPIKLRISFDDAFRDGKSAEYQLTGDEDHAELKLRGWNHALPMGIEKPQSLGTFDGRKVEFLFSGFSLRDAKHLKLDFFWGATDVN